MIVHGLNGHPERTWTHPSSQFYWPWELRVHLPDTRVMVYGFDADIAPAFGSNRIGIKGLAQGFLGQLTEERQEEYVRIRLVWLGAPTFYLI